MNSARERRKLTIVIAETVTGSNEKQDNGGSEKGTDIVRSTCEEKAWKS